MERNRDIVIIGGGVIGLTTAWRLTQSHWRVTVIDQNEIGREASWAAAGIIPPGCFHKARLGVDQLRAYGTRQIPKLSAELRELTSIDNGYRRCGAMEHFTVVPENLIERWNNEEIRFTPTTYANRSIVHFPDFAQVRTPRHVRALMTACQKVGVEFRPNVNFQSWITENDSIIGMETNVGQIHADRFIIAAGAWSERLLQPLNVELGIHPVQGEMLLYKPERSLLSNIILTGKRYMVPRDDGRILVGSTESASSGFDKRITPEARASLSQFAVELLPELCHIPIEQQWSGLRPGSRDGVPTIDFVPGHRNVIVAAGHFRAGIQQSIGTADIVTAMLNEVPSPIPREPFAVDRPAPLHEPLFQS